ncbi:DUF969 domain-containing protein [Lactiplantibacillus dongliensis]|uniref:DUF969 domain-containing protein n=1 Tax=Lactiplantibacillus dongliensis TaxID=2559919 RepID=A0ABW1RA61_9LACO|nr:DUF969 domain-containing protein [Lactiplantibacillus dongliensis]
MEYLKLIGIVIIILGFALKFDTIAVVIISAVATALVAGISVPDLLTLLGKSFVENRVVSLFFLTLPMIGVIERHGLKQAAVNAIKKLKNLTPGRILNLYLLIREVACAFGITLSGQVQFVRPLISPMVQAAAGARGKLTPKQIDLIKARSAATDNFGNFYAQNLFVASGGVLLMASTMKSLGHAVEPTSIVLYSIPMAVITFIITAIYNMRFDRQFNVKRNKKQED